MKHKKLRRDDVFQQIIERTGGKAIFRTARVDKNGDHVARAIWAGEKLVVILEQARQVVGYNLFSKSQLKRATKYTRAFLEEKRVLWQRSEQ